MKTYTVTLPEKSGFGSSVSFVGIAGKFIAGEHKEIALTEKQFKSLKRKGLTVKVFVVDEPAESTDKEV